MLINTCSVHVHQASRSPFTLKRVLSARWSITTCQLSRQRKRENSRESGQERDLAIAAETKMGQSEDWPIHYVRDAMFRRSPMGGCYPSGSGSRSHHRC
jgi:hypothetical protein